MKNKLILLALALALTTSSCSWFGGKKKDSADDLSKADKEALKKPADETYREAKALMDKGSYTKAVAQFNEVERLYPFSPYANKAKVNAALANYYDEEYDKAIDLIDDFVSLNPGNEEVQFMYYLKAICYYDRITDVKRDQEITLKAEKSFEEVINRFPDSKYAKDSKYKLDLIRDHLAAKDMEIGRFYSKKGNYIAALNRYQEVVKDFDNTEQIEEALYRLVETNMALGFDSEAVKYGTILGYNYPSGKWYKRAYNLLNEGKMKEDKKTFLGKMVDSVGLGEEPAPTKPADLKSMGNLVNKNVPVISNVKPEPKADDTAKPADKAAEAPVQPTTDTGTGTATTTGTAAGAGSWLNDEPPATNEEVKPAGK